MDPWYKHSIPRREVREGRSFSPDEFAIALEQVVAGTAPEDYTKPEHFFSRTCFTRALKDLVGAVGVARQDPALASQVEGATARAQQVLEAGLPNTKGRQL